MSVIVDLLVMFRSRVGRVKTRLWPLRVSG